MTNVLLILLITGCVLGFDSVYIYFARDFFESQIVRVQKTAPQINFTAAALCYALIVFSLYYFIILPHRPIQDAILLGFVIYGIYETTTMALLKNWSWKTVIMDTLWGASLYGLTTAVVYKLTR
jgi:uncharacterized membrane protein